MDDTAVFNKGMSTVIKLQQILATLAMVLIVCLTGATSNAQASDQSVTATQDRLMIQDLMSRYEWALYSGDAKAYGALFAADAILAFDGPNEIKGRDAIVKTVPDQPAHSAKVIHSYSNLAIDLQDDKAEARSNWIAVRNGATGAPEIVAGGEYIDKLVKVNGRWYFARRDIHATVPSVAQAGSGS